MSTATAQALNRPLTNRGHQHVEAFCLMWYACHSCSHSERFWNSRDGATPFCTRCPSCGRPDLHHVHFFRDVYAPDHVPHPGQRVWVSMTKERAEFYAQRQVNAMKAAGRRIDAEDAVLQSLADSHYEGGAGPDLVIHGYQEMPQ